MFELVLRKVHLLDSPVRYLLQLESSYAITAEGSLYRIKGSALEQVLSKAGAPRYAAPGLGGVVAVFKSGEAHQVYRVRGGSSEKLATLPKLSGFPSSGELAAAWYIQPGKLLQSQLAVVRPGQPTLAVETPRVIVGCAASGSPILQFVDGKLKKLALEGGS